MSGLSLLAIFAFWVFTLWHITLVWFSKRKNSVTAPAPLTKKLIFMQVRLDATMSVLVVLFEKMQAFMLYHNTLVFQEYGILGGSCRQFLMHHHARAVLLEDVSCQWGDRCPHAKLGHSYHSYSHTGSLHMSCSSRMRTYYCQVMLHPSASS